MVFTRGRRKTGFGEALVFDAPARAVLKEQIFVSGLFDNHIASVGIFIWPS